MLSFEKISNILSKKKNIFISDCRNNNSEAIRNRIIGHLNHQFTKNSQIPVKTKILRRRFPVDQVTWDKLLVDAPQNAHSLTKSTNSDLTIWIKTDKLCNRLKFKILSKNNLYPASSPRDFLFSEIEPIPVEQLPGYAPVLALFSLSHIRLHTITDNLSQKLYARKIDTLSKYLDHEITNLSKNMPSQFVTTLKHLQIWAWQTCGELNQNNARLSHSIRSYSDLLDDNSNNYSDKQLGQILGNISTAKYTLAKLSSGAEVFEDTIDAVNHAQKFNDRVTSPEHWAELQKLKAESQIGLSKRRQDKSYLEQAVHTLRTVKRIYNSHNQKTKAAHIERQIGDLLIKLGKEEHGTERIEQAISSYHSAISHFKSANQDSHINQTCLSLGKTLIALGDKSYDNVHYHESLKYLKKVKSNWLYKKPRDFWISNLLYAEALFKLGCKQNNVDQVERFLDPAIQDLTWINRNNQNLNLEEKILCDELLGRATSFMGKQKISINMLLRSCQHIKNAINLTSLDIITPKNKVLLKQIKARLLIELARNLSWLHNHDFQEHYLDEAISAYKNVIALHDKTATTQGTSLLKNELADLFIKKSKIDSSNELNFLDQGIDNYKLALKEIRKKTSPMLWATTKKKLAQAYTLSGSMGGGTAHLVMAAETYEKVLEIAHPEILPEERAVTLNKMANVLSDIARRENSTEKLSKARAALVEAYDLFASVDSMHDLQKINDHISAIDQQQKNTTGNSKTQPINYINGISSNLTH